MTTCCNTGLGEAERCIHPGDAKIHLSEDTVSHLQRSAPSSPLSVRKVPGPASLLDVKIESALPGTVPTLLCICPAPPLDGYRGRAPFARPYVGSPAHLLPTHRVSPTRPNPSCSKSGLHLPRAQLNRSVPNKTTRGNSLAVQWLGPHSLTPKGVGSNPDWGTKILHAMQCNQKKKKGMKYHLQFQPQSLFALLCPVQYISLLPTPDQTVSQVGWSGSRC